MRTILSIAAIAVLFSFSACGKKGISDELKGQMRTFEADWKTTGEALTAYGATMNTTFGEMATMMEANNAIPTTGLAPQKASSVDSLKAICTSITQRTEMIRTSYDATLKGFAADEAAYKEWKGKVQQKEISEDDAPAGLGDFNTKLTAYKDNMTAWASAVQELNDRCTATCKAIEVMTK